jgi:hypothetical protein
MVSYNTVVLLEIKIVSTKFPIKIYEITTLLQVHLPDKCRAVNYNIMLPCYRSVYIFLKFGHWRHFCFVYIMFLQSLSPFFIQTIDFQTRTIKQRDKWSLYNWIPQRNIVKNSTPTSACMYMYKIVQPSKIPPLFIKKRFFVFGMLHSSM